MSCQPRLRSWVDNWLFNNQTCLLCDERTDTRFALCTACELELPWLGDSCQRCALPLPMAGLTCGFCLKHPPAFESVHAPWVYGFPIDSLIIRFADEHRVPAGSALAVDREGFSKAITDFLRNHPLVTIFNDEVTELVENEDTIIATGPLTSDPLAEFIRKRFNQSSLYFYDAAAPIIEKDSINFDIAYYKSRYDKGDAQDYINCPMTKEEFEHWHSEK